MGAEINGGAAAPAGESQNKTASGAFPHEMMQGVFARFGRKLPDAPTASEGEKGKGDEPNKGEGQEGGVEAPADGRRADEGKGKGEGAEGAPAGGAEASPGEGAGEPGGQGADDPAANQLEADTKSMVATRLKDLPEETRKTVESVIAERLGAITRKAREESDRLSGRVVELTQEVDTMKRNGNAPVIVPGVHPAMLAETPQDIDRYVASMEAFEDWADRYKDDGYEGDSSKGESSYTAEQIRARLREVRREKEKLIPAARANLQGRVQMDAAAKKLYPAMFKPDTEEYAQAQSILKTMPELRKFADCNIMVLQQILGRKAFQALLPKQPAAGGKGGQPGDSAPNGGEGKAAAKPPQGKRAPRAPGAGSPANGSVLDQPNSQPAADEAIKTFTKTRSRSDLRKAVGALVFTS